MHISAVILSFNSGKTLTRCLTDLSQALAMFQSDNEIFVVDNGSTDSSRAIVDQFREQFPGLIHAINFDENTGTTFSRNRALEKATGDYILVLDSDAYVNYDALQSLIQYLSNNPQTGLAAPRLSYANGNYQKSCDVFPTLVHKLRRFFLLRSMEDQDTALRNASTFVDVDCAISACWMIRRDAFEAVGMLDEKIFYSPEDVDYCLRVWESGYKVTYIPDARVIHDAQELSRGFRISRFHFSHLLGLFYLFRKHKYFFGLRRLYRRLNRT